MDAEVIVVGAGPAGASTAYFLAQSGRHVLLLDRKSFPRDKSCGDGLTRPAVQILREMGVLPHLEKGQKVQGVRVIMRGQGSRDFPYPDGEGALVIPRLLLDHAICQQAVRAGAELRENTVATGLVYDGEVVSGVEILSGGEHKQLRSAVVVAADGAASRLAMQSGLLPRDPNERDMGYAIRGYYTDISRPIPFLEIYMPLLDMTDRYLLPSYGWVFPTGPHTANIGVGLFRRERGTNIRELFERFLDELKQNEAGFQAARPSGPWKGAPLRFNFSEDRCARPGMLLVGDAAGLVSPFTGEGISYALESGKTAALVIDESLASRKSTPDLSTYGHLLERSYGGYFETGRHAARRYLLVWHVLDSTFRNDKPLYALSREAVILPEGMGDSLTSGILEEVGTLVGEYRTALRSDLLAVGDLMLDAVRPDWPFLARFALAGGNVPQVPFRPALLALLASYLKREPPASAQTAIIAAALELGYLASLAELSVMDESSDIINADEGRPANWGNMFAVLVGDFLLSKAYQLIGQAGAGVTRTIAEGLATACEGQVRGQRYARSLEQTQAQHLEILAQKGATLFELPCGLGARLAGASDEWTLALTVFGHHLGLAFQLTQEIRALSNHANGLDQLTLADLSAGIYSLPILLTVQRPGSDSSRLRLVLEKRALNENDIRMVGEIVQDSGGDGRARAVARDQVVQAKIALTPLGNHPVRSILARLADYAVTRDAGIPKS